MQLSKQETGIGGTVERPDRRRPLPVGESRDFEKDMEGRQPKKRANDAQSAHCKCSQDVTLDTSRSPKSPY